MLTIICLVMLCLFMTHMYTENIYGMSVFQYIEQKLKDWLGLDW